MKTIFEQQTLTGFTYNATYGLYVFNINPAPFELVLGETYSVYWDGEIYVCESQDLSSMGEGYLALGNLSAFGGQGNNEPFIIGWSFVGVSVFAFDEKTEHEIAIYQESAEEPETPEMPDGDGFILKNYHGEDVLHEGVDRIVFNGADGGEVIFSEGDAVDNVPITLDFSNGDQTVTAPDGTLVKSAVIIKPENLVPENIADGEMVAGILGTHKGGGGSEMESTLNQEHWLDDVCFWDLEGNLIKNVPMSETKNFTQTDFPTAPTYDNLTFQCWNHSLEDIQSTEYPLDIAPIYSTTDGKTHLKVKPYSTSYLDLQFNFSQTIANGVTFDFGDGSAPVTVGGTGVVAVKHTYSAVAEYDVVITVSDGCTLQLGGGTSALTLISKVSATSNSVYYSRAVLECRVADGVAIGACCFNNSQGLKFLSLPKTLLSIADYTFSGCYYTKMISVPPNVEQIGDQPFHSFGNSLTNVNVVISLPQSVTSLGSISSKNMKRLVIPKLVTSIQSVSTCEALRKVFLPMGATSIPSNFLYRCFFVKDVVLPRMITAINDGFMDYCVSDYIEIPPMVTTIGNCFSNARIKTLYIPSSVTSITKMFNYGSCERIIFEDVNKITTISTKLQDTVLKEMVILSSDVPNSKVLNISAFSYALDVFVPDAVLDDYKTLLSRKYARVYPLSEYNGTFAV